MGAARLCRAVAILSVLATLAIVTVACQVGVSMWGACSPSSTGNPFGTDGEWVLVCRDGTWEPIMTVEEYLRIRHGEHVNRQPLPQRPTTTTTTTTTLPPESVLDQYNLLTSNDGSFIAGSCWSGPGSARLASAQTFTAGLTGDLTRIDLWVTPWPDRASVQDITLRVVTMAAGVPSATVIGEGTYDGDGSTGPEDLVTIELTSPAPVSTGTQYAFVVSAGSEVCADSDPWHWQLWFDSPSSYAGGNSWVHSAPGPTSHPTMDWSFRTWVRP